MSAKKSRFHPLFINLQRGWKARHPRRNYHSFIWRVRLLGVTARNKNDDDVASIHFRNQYSTFQVAATLRIIYRKINVFPVGVGAEMGEGGKWGGQIPLTPRAFKQFCFSWARNEVGPAAMGKSRPVFLYKRKQTQTRKRFSRFKNNFLLLKVRKKFREIKQNPSASFFYTFFCCCTVGENRGYFFERIEICQIIIR